MGCWEKRELRFYIEGVRDGAYSSRILEHLAPEINGYHSMLDICSGPGAFALWALIRGWQVTALDLEPLALAALEQEAVREPGQLTTVCNDFLSAELQPAELTVAACCFYADMAEQPALGRIMDLAQRAALFVRHHGPHLPEFGSEGLPMGPDHHDRQLNHMEENLQLAAEQRGLKLNSAVIRCDFGCHYHPGDEDQMAFLMRKTNALDKELLRQRLEEIAIARPDGLWLPNYKDMMVNWIIK